MSDRYARLFGGEEIPVPIERQTRIARKKERAKGQRPSPAHL